MELLRRIKEHLDNGKPVRTMELTDDERDTIKDAFFLTDKKVIYVANVSENQISNNRY